MCEFTLTYKGRSYTVIGDPWMSLETIWLSQKCWFMKGAVVTIMDERGNIQTFVRE